MAESKIKEEQEKPDGDGDQPDVVTEQASGDGKDDCSDLTGEAGENNEEAEEQNPKSFPEKLMDILAHEEYSDIISWLPHGNGFVIHKKKSFANDILPKYFKASKFTSFTRKLNRWGFSRAPRGPETGAYFHKLFRRDKPDLCLQMTSNSGNKYHSAPMQQQILPAVPAGFMGGPAMMGGGGGMPFYPMPMMMGGGGQLSPQQQALWQQQMQVFQLQQMQMMHMQQQQQQQAGGMRMPMPMMPPMMQPPMMHPAVPQQQAESKPTNASTQATTTETDLKGADESLNTDNTNADSGGVNLDGVGSQENV